MKSKLALLIFVLILASKAIAQNTESIFTIKGTVADSVSRQGEPYATISVAKKENPKKAVKMALTKQDGTFKETIKGKGDFILTVTSMGRKSIVKDFSIKRNGETFDFDTLLITDNANELKDVEIVAQKPLVKSDIDKIEYNIEEDPDSKSSTIIEMLRKVPLVTVDGEDNIKVNGSGSFKIYVNGKPNNMMTKNPTEVLKSMPANSIKRIEVITNPGPKYDAEGVGGILNIITMGKGMEGYTVTLGATARNTGGGGNMFGTVQKGKFTLSARYNYNHNAFKPNYSNSNRTTTGGDLASSSDVISNSRSKYRSNFNSGSIEASYEIDTLRLVSASFSMWGGNNSNHSSSSLAATSPLDGSSLYKYTTAGRGNGSWWSIEGGIDYQRLFHVKNRMLTFSYRIETSPDNNDSYTDYNDKEATTDWAEVTDRLENLYIKEDENSTEQTFQIDYTTPIGKMHTIETGAKYIIRENKSENDRYTMASNSDSYSFDSDNSTHYKHRNDIIAAYAGYGLKWKKLSGRLGLRYEHTIQDVKYLLGEGDNFNKDFDDLVPSASIGYKLSDATNLRLGYKMRISRPSIWYLNPYLDDTNPTSISQGNSNLESEKNHSVDMRFNCFTSKFSLSLTLQGAFTNNSIESVSEYINDTQIAGLQNPTGKSVLYTTYKNIGKTRSAHLSGYINWNMTSSTRIYANIQGSYVYLSDGMSLRNDGWYMFAYGGIQQTLPKEWRLSFNYYTNTPYISLQGKGMSFTDYSVSVNKSFLKKRLNISANINNFFNRHYKGTSTTTSTNFIQKRSYNNYIMRCSISVSYRFGELKASVKKAERTISNDDVKEGGSSNGNQ